MEVNRIYVILDKEGTIQGCFKSLHRGQIESVLSMNNDLDDFVITGRLGEIFQAHLYKGKTDWYAEYSVTESNLF